MRKSNLILRLIFLITLILLLVLRLIYFNILIFSKDEVNEPIVDNVKPIVIDREEVEVDEYMQKLEEIYKENNDTFGYLIIPGTKVEYPVMYTRGEDYYLRKNIYKQYSVAGTLYIDKYNNISPRDDNLIIYGHNMNNGTMFADLLKYKNRTFYTGHKTIYFYTLNGKEEYIIVSAFISKVYTLDDTVFKYYKEYNFNSASDFDYFKGNILSMTLYDTSVEINYGDTFITLSTCEYTEKNGRFVVVAKKV